MRVARAVALLFTVAVPLVLGACRTSTQASTQPPQQPPPYYQPYPGQPYPNQPYPNQPYPNQPYPNQPNVQPQPQPQPQPQAQRPLLPPLVGMPAMQQETRNVLAELVNALPAQNQALVRGIPMTFDPTEEVNAFAGCDDSGAPFLAATVGILEAIDAVAQTRSTDELFGTHTYDDYCNAVMPALVKSPNARAALPAGIIPQQYGGDLRRWSRAHEIFDEVIAFTFGHELGHHYLGHTGCAHGQPLGPGPDPTKLGRLLSVVPLFNQANETAADTAGTINALDAGRARRPQYEWNESGGVLLFDYFSRLERASGNGGLLGLLNPVGFLRTHPNPQLRSPWVQTVARNWHAQHPG